MLGEIKDACHPERCGAAAAAGWRRPARPPRARGCWMCPPISRPPTLVLPGSNQAEELFNADAEPRPNTSYS